MLDNGETADRALGAQRCAAVHGDGRDGGGGAHRGAGRPRHPHGGRPAGGAGARDRDRGGAGGARAGRHRLHRGARHPVAARAHRPALCRDATASTVDPARVVVTTGSSAGFILAFLALFEPGDRVAIADPGLSAVPPHPRRALGCEPVLIETIGRDALGDHRRGAARGAPRRRRSRACWSRARPIRPAP